MRAFSVAPAASMWRQRALMVGSLALAPLGGCLAKSKTVQMPDGRPALRIECNYDASNCRNEARSSCRHGYDVVTTGDMSCIDCGLTLDTQDSHGSGSNVYTGVLYVRCR